MDPSVQTEAVTSSPLAALSSDQHKKMQGGFVCSSPWMIVEFLGHWFSSCKEKKPVLIDSTSCKLRPRLSYALSRNAKPVPLPLLAAFLLVCSLYAPPKTTFLLFYSTQI
ncbi:hypothetical protein AVEN_178765-1 [Araneus ventricosus]|uniref:Uncharacterized protein n=1 Tax=Araneus ventricosus TaxID=182803 RepID=A0A4Y2H9I1_ARAVE|nr:hypothetical protein AVEN_178765-1 [Araneus ventricosus]